MAGKILHLTTVHPRRDVRIYSRMVSSLADVFPGRVEFVVADGLGPERLEGVTIHDLGSLRRGRFLRFLLGSWRAYRAVGRLRPALVHFHDPELLPLALVLRIRGYPVVYDVHEELRKQILSKAWIPRAFRRAVAAGVGLIETLVGRAMSGIVAAAPAITRPLRNKRIVLVQNFPRPEEGLGTACRNQPSLPTFAYVGGITKRRALFEMLEAIEFVNRDTRARLVLAGWFNPPELQEHARRQSGWRHTEYVGWLDRKGVAKLLAESTAGLVLFGPEPNHLEIQPTKLYEYLWAGIPVIASNFPYWRNIVKDLDLVTFAEPTDARDIARAMLSVCKSDSGGKEKAAEAKRYAARNFNWNNELQALLELYRSILGDSLINAYKQSPQTGDRP